MLNPQTSEERVRIHLTSTNMGWNLCFPSSGSGIISWPSLHSHRPSGAAPPSAQHPVPGGCASTRGSQQGRTSNLLTREPAKEPKGCERKDVSWIFPSAPTGLRSLLGFSKWNFTLQTSKYCIRSVSWASPGPGDHHVVGTAELPQPVLPPPPARWDLKPDHLLPPMLGCSSQPSPFTKHRPPPALWRGGGRVGAGGGASVSVFVYCLCAFVCRCRLPSVHRRAEVGCV